MELSTDLETNLKWLSEGSLIVLPTMAGWMLAGDAANDGIATSLLLEGDDPVLLLAEEKDLLKYISALDLSIMDRMAEADAATAFYFEGVLGVSDVLLGKNGAIYVALTKDDFLFSLLKRSRKALAMVTLGEDQLIRELGSLPTHLSPLIRNGYLRKKFV